MTPIKDVKTMIRAFAYAKRDVPNLKLWIMGPTEEDEEYARECFELVELMELPDVVFTGRVNVTEYLGGLDFTILTSISAVSYTHLNYRAMDMINFAVASSAIKHTIHGDANITDDVSTIRNLMNMNYDIKR